MNNHYKLINEVRLPVHEGDEHTTVIRMYDISEEKYDFLYSVQCYQKDDGTYGPHNPAPRDVADACCVEFVILDDLGLTTDTYVAPGALFKMYDATMWCRTVMIAETTAYNV